MKDNCNIISQIYYYNQIADTVHLSITNYSALRKFEFLFQLHEIHFYNTVVSYVKLSNIHN